MVWIWSVATDSTPWILININRFHDVAIDLMQRKNGTYTSPGSWFGSTDYVATVNPINIHYVTTTNFQNYPKGDEYRKIFEVMGYTLFNSDDEEWKQHRRLHASEHNDRVLDMQDVFQRFALDVVCMSVTGHDPESLAINSPNVPFLGALTDFEGGIVYRIAFPELLWKLQLLLGVGPENKLNHALVMKDGFTQITDINDKVFFHDTTLQQLIAGRDTSSSALTWFIWLMVTHPEVEQKIRNEINVKTPGLFPMVSLPFILVVLVYIHEALIESMRLYPPVPFQYKSSRQPDTLPSGHQVHPKTKILIPLYAMARMKSIWGQNCSEFNPERWISDRGTIKHEPSSKYFIFYAGPRSCLGKDSAMTQMKMVAATLVHNFRFELVKGQIIEPDVSMILHVKHGLKVKVHSRWA
ncbi:alkane hydroxylase MAH1-like [Silene latifolia]|uniref:alkane hydroxylase MAH1-like n=1 Tax=Silene latifolia TaxID=37657 RepID=UPI003D77CC0F